MVSGVLIFFVLPTADSRAAYFRAPPKKKRTPYRRLRQQFIPWCILLVFENILAKHVDLNWTNFSFYFWKETKWKRCKRLISGEEKLNRTFVPPNHSEILNIYKQDQECAHVIQARFGHHPVTKEEMQLPIAYAFTIYKGARLFERILQAIYMPNNVYCIHIDKKSPEVFRRAIQTMIRCLPNVFISVNSTNVVWGHFSVVQAQLNCMEELLQSPVKWKYYISLVGQDFPLYDNKQIVQALQSLNNSNSIGSVPLRGGFQRRTKFAYLFKGRRFFKGKRKPPPPHNISVFKGSTHIIAIREFVDFVLHSEIGRDFTEFLKDTFIPDETLYASLQQHPLAPGCIHGKQPDKWIPRALYWLSGNTRHICHGNWVRALCWITLEDLQWALGEKKKDKLFVHKIPFNFNDDLIECILVARQGRKYATSVWNRDESTNN